MDKEDKRKWNLYSWTFDFDSVEDLDRVRSKLESSTWDLSGLFDETMTVGQIPGMPRSFVVRYASANGNVMLPAIKRALGEAHNDEGPYTSEMVKRFL